MTDFTQRVAAYAAEEQMWRKGDRILVACSGGPDSLALAYWFAQHAETLGVQVGVAYVHHHLRAAADAEVEFVRDFAAREGLPFYGLEADIPALAKATGRSIETAARAERYRLLFGVLRQEGYNLLAVAHHADDQAETILHHILRGTGLRGLRGMLPKTGPLIRPFLCVTRRDVEQYLTEVPYEPRLDETNTDTKYLRNALRHEVLPFLRKYNPQITAALCRLGETARHDVEYLRETAWAEVRYHAEPWQGTGLQVARNVFVRWPVAVQRQCVRYMYDRIGRVTPDYGTVQTVCALVRRGRTGTRHSANGVTTVLTADRIRFAPSTMAKPVREPAQVLPDAEGYMALGKVAVRLANSTESQPGAIPTAALQGPLRLRHRLPGDRIHLKKGTKKWKDWLIDRKVPRDERDEWILLADDRFIYRAYSNRGNSLFRAVTPPGEGPYIIPMEIRRQ